MRDDRTTVAEIRERIAEFIRERDWEQYHSPKNLSMSIAIEAAELMEIFQWLDLDEARSRALAPETRARVAEEAADIAIYILSLCNTLGLDLASCIEEKLEKNRRKYPAERCRGEWQAPSDD